MFKNKLVIFLVEGPSDEDALMVPLENKLTVKQIKTKVKVFHTDILTEYKVEESNIFKITSSNIIGELKKVIEAEIKKISGLKFRDIGKIIYITDTDNCFFRDEAHSKNKKECLKVLFNKREIELGKGSGIKKIPLDIVFMSQNLEYVLTGELRKYSDEEKEIIATEFKEKCEENFEEYVNFFTSDIIKKWNTYEESYVGIQTINERASNMNCLLEEILL
mgnify:CR=1 FL=1